MQATLPSPSPAIAAVKPRLLAQLISVLQRTWLRCAVLLLSGIAVHYPSLQGQLIWDDDYLIRENPLIKSPLLVFETFRHHLFLDSSSPHYRPVQNISYCLDYLIWKGDLFGYHLTNILLHAGSGILLYFLLRHILSPLLRSWKFDYSENGRRASTAAFWIALIWTVHPVHSAAVDYLSGRADSLAAVFSCGAWLLYLRGQSASSPPIRASFYSVAFFCALLAFCSRESAAIWLTIFLFHLFAFDSSSRRRKCAVVGACLCVVGTYLLLHYLPEARGGIAATTGSQPVVVRLTLMMRALGDYGRLLFYPANLHMDRAVEMPETLLGNAGWRLGIRGEYLSVLGLVAAAALGLGAFRKGPARGMRAFGVAWFVLAFLPISNLVELNASVAEHWLYLPSIGFLVFMFGCALELRRFPRQLARVALSIALIGLSVRSFVRSGDWLNAETFYRNSLASGAAKPRMALNLGIILTGKGDYPQAERLLRRVVAIEPDYPIAINALAHLLYREGKLDEATKYFSSAAKVAERTRDEYPRTWVAALNVAHLRYADHDRAGALAIVQQATRDYPGTWDLVSFQSELLRELKGPEAALPVVKDFVGKNWWHAPAAIAIAKLYSEAGAVGEAEDAFRHASRLDIYGVEALNLLALLEVRHNRLEAAFAIQDRAVSRQPDQPRQYLLLSDILEKMGRGDEARAALAQVQQLQALAKAN